MSQPAPESAKPEEQNNQPPSNQQAVQPAPAAQEAAKPSEKAPTDWQEHARTWEDRARTNKAQLDQMQQQWNRLASIFTPESADEGQKPEDMIQALTERFEQSERRAAINDLARRHGIQADADIALLASVADDTQREALALRLKGQQQVIPPDPGQGATTPASTEDAEYEQFFPTRK